MSKTRRLVAVVDDEEPVRKALERLLRSAGLDVETFNSGARFLESVAEHTPSCVVLDLHMPRVTGFDVQARLAVTHGSLPVVIITAHDSQEAHDRAIEGGAKAYLRKPVDGQALLDAIASAIKEPPAPGAGQ